MKIAITGASGFLGGPLSAALRERGHDVVAARRTDAPAELAWAVDTGFSPRDALSGYDVVVHLAGEAIAGGRWTDERKTAILESRRQGTRRVVEALEAAQPRPRALICASGVGIYGDAGERVVDESAPLGDDFTAEVAIAWEREAAAARALGVRVATMRTGMVLGRGGGALAKMLPAFRLGLGGRLGDGEQYVPWIHLDDAVAAYVLAIESDDVTGPINVVAPHPVKNREFVRRLGGAVRRPAFIPAPMFALRAVFGEMATLLVTGQRAEPKRLTELGFTFGFSDLAPALADLVG
jgi:uncharacterized protein (TIGR01777 family)